MRKNTKFLSLICIVLMSTFVLNPVKSLAQTENAIPDYSNEQMSEEVGNLNSIEQENDNIQPYISAKGILLSGILIGWYVSGSIQYLTGKAPPAWIAMGLKGIENKIKGYLKTPLYSQAMVNSAGVVSAKCVVYPCPITSYSENEDE